ncbi:MAG: hypothetical protein EA397_08760 [Deltaproteobacteria bacterium]|nr:MAG: hypothetical protein EA397_08760 [Deltaproteobacteria bacterium]
MKLTLETILYVCAVLAIIVGISLGLAGEDLVDFAIFGWVGGALLAAAGLVVRSPRWGTLGSASIGLSAGLYLYWLKVRPTEGPALCSVNETIDCVSINDSSYSVIFAGTGLETPITLLGAGYYLGLIVASLSAPKKAPRFFVISAGLALFALMTSLYLASVLLVEQKICVFCIAMYLSNALILWAALKGVSQSEVRPLDELSKAWSDKSFWTVAGCFFGVVVAGHLVYPASSPEPHAPVDLAGEEAKDRLLRVDLDKLSRPLSAPLELHGAEPAKGASNPRYILVEFADYSCPFCRGATLEVMAALDQHPDVQVLFKSFPRTKECNPSIPRDAPSGGAQLCAPFLYAECARQQGRFWDVNRDIFFNQQALIQTGFRSDDLDVLVRNRGVDLASLRRCLDDPESHRIVQLDALAGARAGLQGTPSFYIKGIREDGGWSQVQIREGVREIFTLIAAHRAQNPLEAEPSDSEAAPRDPAQRGNSADDGFESPSKAEPKVHDQEDPADDDGVDPSREGAPPSDDAVPPKEEG